MEQETCADHVRKKTAAAVAYEGHGHALGRHGSEYHCEIHGEAESHGYGQAVGGELVAQDRLGKGHLVAAPEEGREQTYHKSDADETRLFTDDGHDEVVMSFWQSLELLHASSQPDAENAAAAQSEEGLHHLIAAAPAVREGVEEGYQTGHAVRLDQDEDDSSYGQKEQHDDEVASLGLASEEEEEDQHAHDGGPAVVRLEQEQAADNARDDARRYQTSHHLLDHAFLGTEEVGHIDDESHTGEFHGLEHDELQVYPARGALDGLAYDRAQGQKDYGYAYAPVVEPVDEGTGEPAEHGDHDAAHAHEDELIFEEMVGGMILFHAFRAAGTEHGQKAYAEEQEEQKEQPPVHGAGRRRFRRGWRRRGLGAAYVHAVVLSEEEKALTRERKCSPRSR